MWKFLFGDKSKLTPARPLISQKTDLFSLPRDEDVVVWMGHSNFYLQLGGRRILIDPSEKHRLPARRRRILRAVGI